MMEKMESQVVLVGMEVTEVMQRLIWEVMHLEGMEAVEGMGAQAQEMEAMEVMQWLLEEGMQLVGMAVMEVMQRHQQRRRRRRGPNDYNLIKLD